MYVDDADVKKHGCAWFHLMADSTKELHEFASTMGVPMRAFHRGARHPHYDVTTSQRQTALERGAAAITARHAVLIGRKAVQATRDSALNCHQISLIA